ncbi:hypothetical protein J3R30DRAFT_3693609 [Lentinula aciculospora]|uniref:Uncharacterized protein n=1 Tax=Lentinula aciculospora TaxID=153920 RepID=A0A9W9AVK6_9AGAR|nr:hypothetical protein J3R30DRAFT_3693609 [Lentinula aciculospora]
MLLSTIALIGVVGNSIFQYYLANWQDTSSTNAVSPTSASDEIGTVPIFTTSQALHIVYIYTGIFVFDICVVSLTLWKTLRMYKEEHVPGGIGIIIMRDGLSYFIVITLLTLANIVAYLVGTEFTKSSLTILSNSMSAIMMSRLMLNLRKEQSIETLDDFSLSRLAFASFENG